MQTTSEQTSARFPCFHARLSDRRGGTHIALKAGACLLAGSERLRALLAEGQHCRLQGLQTTDALLDPGFESRDIST